MEAAAPPPPSLPSYIFAERLGSGSYATVYRATSKCPQSDSGIRETFAIKCIERARIAPHQTAVNNLVREIGIMKTLRHRHIVMLRDFRWDPKLIYLIMEFCPGGDLSSFIRQHRIVPEEVVRRFLQQLASALAYLRSRNISHMDLKPQNILLATKHRPIILKLGDFGFATYLRSGMDASSFRGSPLYMAPEIFNQRTYDARVDLWSVGVILFECLFGRAPFSAPSLDELIDQIKTGETVKIPPQPELSADCHDLLAGLLRRNPNHRLNFDEFFQHPFVDLEHAPSEETLAKATDIAKMAVKADHQGRTASAIKLYFEALEYFLPCLQLVEHPDSKSQMRRKIQGYLRRAESLKHGLNPPSETRPRTAKSLTEMEFLLESWSDVPQVHAATTVVQAAESMESREDWSGALSKYTLAIESMLDLMKNEPCGPRKDVLKKRLEIWMMKAEALKSYLEVQRISLSRMVENERETEVVDEQTESLSKDSNCVIQ